MKIVYFGQHNSTSTAFHRASALKRLGHEVELFDPYKEFASSLSSKFSGFFHYRTGYFFLQAKVKRWIKSIMKETPAPDVIWINGGELFGPASISLLKNWQRPIILYNNDDPTGKRDGYRFGSLLKAIPMYDLCVVVRNINVPEYLSRKAKKVIRVYMSYDEEVHRSFKEDQAIPDQFKSSIAFIGTWMQHEKRDQFLLKLIEKGLPVSIWGDHWQKSSLWKQLKPNYKGKALGGREYVAAIQGAKICIGMLSKGNRDLHTTRSAEIPYIGGLLCAERTAEHEVMYTDGVEAVFWSNAEECIRICHELLNNNEKREQIRFAGMKRVRELKIGNEDICKQILAEL